MIKLHRFHNIFTEKQKGASYKVCGNVLERASERMEIAYKALIVLMSLILSLFI